MRVMVILSVLLLLPTGVFAEPLKSPVTRGKNPDLEETSFRANRLSSHILHLLAASRRAGRIDQVQCLNSTLSQVNAQSRRLQRRPGQRERSIIRSRVESLRKQASRCVGVIHGRTTTTVTVTRGIDRRVEPTHVDPRS